MYTEKTLSLYLKLILSTETAHYNTKIVNNKQKSESPNVIDKLQEKGIINTFMIAVL